MCTAFSSGWSIVLLRPFYISDIGASAAAITGRWWPSKRGLQREKKTLQTRNIIYRNKRRQPSHISHTTEKTAVDLFPHCIILYIVLLVLVHHTLPNLPFPDELCGGFYFSPRPIRSECSAAAAQKYSSSILERNEKKKRTLPLQTRSVHCGNWRCIATDRGQTIRELCMSNKRWNMTITPIRA